MNKQMRYSPEVRERAVRLVYENQGDYGSQWAAMVSIAPKIGCTPETLRTWVRQSETNQGIRGGMSSSDRDRLKELERENRELKRANAEFSRIQGDIHGDFNTFNARSSPMDFPANQGGQFWDIGVGLNVMAPAGVFAGNSLSVEWLEPIQDDVNGYQLERSSTFALTWNYSFF